MSPLDESITGRWHFSFVLNDTKALLPHFQACGTRRDIEMLVCGVHQRYVVHSLHIWGNPGVTGSLCVFLERMNTCAVYKRGLTHTKKKENILSMPKGVS